MTATGPVLEPPRFRLSRWLFLRLVAFVYLLAFASLTPQILGLEGADGLLPAADYLLRAADFYGAGAYYEFPTLAWLNPGDAGLLALGWAGMLTALLALAGCAPIVTFPLLWLLYLSLSVAGQTFLAFQWDTLLLEVGLLASLYAPLGWRPDLGGGRDPSDAARWLVWALAFKLTFLSGITKLVSGDPTWSGLTALTYHYQTQPLPAWTSWYMHHAPVWMHVGTAAVTLAVELLVPFLVLAPSRLRRTRVVACGLLCLLQLGIAATGNFGFFNLLAVVLYLALLDDTTLARCLPRSLKMRAEAGFLRLEPRPWRTLVALVAAVVAVLSTLALWHEATYRQPRDGWSHQVARLVAPFRSINGYGLFRSMTTSRPEIVVEVSLDGTDWREQPFRWKPGDPGRAPRFVQPHMPRLDWQMWFAALDPAGAEPWLQALMDGLLAGSPAVTGLLGEPPFKDTPPRHVRLAYYRYEFTTPGEGRATGDWWRREPLGYLMEAERAP